MVNYSFEESALLNYQDNWTSLTVSYGEDFLDYFHRNVSNLMFSVCFKLSL